MIDWSRVTTLRDEVGVDEFDEVVELFLEEVDEVVMRLKASPSQDTLGEDLHFLKGSALSLGFRQFSALCQAGETASNTGKPHLIDLEGLIENYSQSRAHFLEDLKKNL